MKAELDPEILAEAVRAVIAENAAEEKNHPSPAELFAFAGGELEEPAADRIRDHLALCERCSERALAARRAAEEEEEEEEEEEAPPFGVMRPPAAPPANAFGGWQLAAATLTLAVGSGLLLGSFWNSRQVTSPTLLELQASQSRRSATPDAWPEASASRAQPLVLVLLLERDGDRETLLSARVFSEDDQEIRLQTSIRADDSGFATLALPPGRLEPGFYRIELGPPVAAEKKVPLVYRFQVLP